MLSSLRDLVNTTKDEGISPEDYYEAMNNMKEYDEVLLDADTYFAKVVHVLKANKDITSLNVVVNPYQSVEEFDLKKLQKACVSSAQIQDLTLHIGSAELDAFDFNFYEAPEVEWTPEQVRALANGLLSLPQLTTLRIDYGKADADACTAFTRLLMNQQLPRSLQTFQVDDYPLQPTCAMNTLCRSLQRHPALEQVILRLSSENGCKQQSLQTLFETLQSLSRLRRVEISDTPRSCFAQGSLTCAPAELVHFLESNTQLQSVRLWLDRHKSKDVAWSKEDLTLVAQALRVRSNLQTLLIGVEAIGEEEATITKAVSDEEQDEDDDESDRTDDDFNSGEFSLGDGQPLTVKALDQDDLELSVQSSHSCQSTRTTTAPQHELFTVLESTNYMLQQLYVFGMKLPSKVQVYLDLNKAGRAQLLQSNAAPEDWMRQIVQHRDNLDATLELLLLNPVALAMTIRSEEEKLAAKAKHFRAAAPRKQKKGWMKRLRKKIFSR